MVIYTDYQKFFGISPLVQRRGTFGVSLVKIRISVAFQNVYNVDNGQILSSVSSSGSGTIMAGTIIHELGHQLDYIWGDLSQKPAFYNLRAPDFAYMDTDPATGQRRPCNTVFDASICTRYTVNGVTAPNSDIFTTEFGNQNDPGAHNGDGEVFVEIFEHLQSVRTGQYMVDPFLEQALNFLPQETSYVQGKINSPPTPVN